MKDNLRTAVRASVFFSCGMGTSLAILFSLKSGNIIKGLMVGLLAGLSFGAIMSFYVLIGLLLFDKRWLFYSNVPAQLQARNAKNIYYESIAGNVTSRRIKYGGLFLTDSSVLFVPHRFAIISTLTEIPFTEIRKIKKTGINLLKLWSGGLRARLHIDTLSGAYYEFSVWNINAWNRKIDERIKQSRSGKTGQGRE